MENSFFIYLIKANIVLIVFYFLFLAFFQRTTFHLTNRLVLLFTLIFSLFLPFIDFSFFSLNKNPILLTEWFENIEEFPVDWQGTEPIVSSANTMSTSFYVLLLYLFGISVMLFRFVNQLRGMFVLKRNAKQTYRAKNIYFIGTGQLPFTFMKWVFLPKKEYNSEELNFIIKHEQAHANQLHTLDNLFAELICIVFWFNPFVFLLKRSMKTVHEYLADKAAACYNQEKIPYLKLLVQGVSYMPDYGLSSNFYWLTIKKRINMITKNKTSRIVRFSYLLLIPAIALIIQSFSSISIGEAQNFKSEINFDGNIPSISPIKSESVKMTSGYGMRMHPIEKVEKMHYAIDLSAKKGTPVVATADGLVVKVEFKKEGKGYGRVVIVKHSEEYSTLYSQLAAFKVQEGDKVKQGDVIGLVGSSGISTGPHLHYEVHKNGERVDPELYMGK